MLRHLAFFTLICFSFTGPGCTGKLERTALPSSVVRFEPGGSSTRFLDVPFPSDIYLESGHLEVAGLERVFDRSANYLAAALRPQKGFSRIAPALFYVDNPSGELNAFGQVAAAKINPASLPEKESDCVLDSSSVFLLDLAPASPAKARIPCRALYRDDTEDGAATRPVLAVGPARGIVLEEGHRYATVVTRRVKDGAGNGLSRSFAFDALLRGESTDSVYVKALADIRKVSGIADEELVGFAPFTTAAESIEFAELADRVHALPPPALGWSAEALAPMSTARFSASANPAFAATLDDWLGAVTAKLPDGSDDPNTENGPRPHDQIAAVGTAAFLAPNFLQKRKNYGDTDHATFARDGSGNPVVAPEKPTNQIWVSIALPKAPMPPAGYPVVIMQHGLGGSRDDLMLIANTCAKKGWATVAIDSITFGSRAADPKYSADTVSEYGSVPSAKYQGPDGFGDRFNDSRNGPLDLFGALQNLGSLRDQMRQAAIDTWSLVAALRNNPDLSPLQTTPTVPKFDASSIAYVGNSLGSIQGSIAAAFEPNVKAWFLNVGGGGLFTELAASSPVINGQVVLAGSFNFGFARDRFDQNHPLSVIGQNIAEAGDPIAYASHLTKNPLPLLGKRTTPRNAILLEVTYDETVSNESTEALARAAGWPLGGPNVGSNSGIYSLKAALDPLHAGSVPFTTAKADADGIHDTPLAGTTAVVVQTSSCQHGQNLFRKNVGRRYSIPFLPKEGPIFRGINELKVTCPYLETQSMLTGFIEDAFAGRVPRVRGFAPPSRDLDQDGTPDDRDPNPVNPNSK